MVSAHLTIPPVPAKPPKDMADFELMEHLTTLKAAEDEAARVSIPLRAELLRRLRRLKATGETDLEHNGWKAKLAREARTEAWFKREYGYGALDLPVTCIGEKIVPEILWDKVEEWLEEPLKATYTLKLEKPKAKKGA